MTAWTYSPLLMSPYPLGRAACTCFKPHVYQHILLADDISYNSGVFLRIPSSGNFPQISRTTRLAHLPVQQNRFAGNPSTADQRVGTCWRRGFSRRWQEDLMLFRSVEFTEWKEWVYKSGKYSLSFLCFKWTSVWRYTSAVIVKHFWLSPQQ